MAVNPDAIAAGIAKEVTSVAKHAPAEKMLVRELHTRLSEALSKVLASKADQGFSPSLGRETVTEAMRAILHGETVTGLPNAVYRSIGKSLRKAIVSAGAEGEIPAAAANEAISSISQSIANSEALRRAGNVIYPTAEEFFTRYERDLGHPLPPAIREEVLRIIPPELKEGGTIKITDRAMNARAGIGQRIRDTVRKQLDANMGFTQVGSSQSGAETLVAATRGESAFVKAMETVPSDVRGEVQAALDAVPGTKSPRDVRRAAELVMKLKGRPATLSDLLVPQVQAAEEASAMAARSAANVGTPEELMSFLGLNRAEAESLLAEGPQAVNEYFLAAGPKKARMPTVSSMLVQGSSVTYTKAPRGLLPAPDKPNMILSDEASIVRQFAPVKGAPSAGGGGFPSERAVASERAAAIGAAEQDVAMSRVLGLGDEAVSAAAPAAAASGGRVSQFVKSLGGWKGVGLGLVGGYLADRMVGDPINERLTQMNEEADREAAYPGTPSISARMQMLANQTYMGPNERSRAMAAGVDHSQQRAMMLAQARAEMGLAPGDNLR